MQSSALDHSLARGGKQERFAVYFRRKKLWGGQFNEIHRWRDQRLF